MKNELFSIGPITIYGYGLMIAIGVLAAYFSATYRAKKYDLDPDKVFYVTVWAVIGGFGGAKLLYLITQIAVSDRKTKGRSHDQIIILILTAQDIL